MSAAPEMSRLKVGGAINADKHAYVVRPSDKEVLELLKVGEYVNVLCSRQMGKTSLIFRTKAELAKVGVRTAYVNVDAQLGTPDRAEDWYVSLLQEIVDELGLGVDVIAWWRSRTETSSNKRLIKFFEDEVVAGTVEPVVVFIDEIEFSLKLPYSDDFFVAIRGMYNDRAREPSFERIAFCLVGVVSPNELIKDRRTTSYNVGRTIALLDFDPDRDDFQSLYDAVISDDHRAGEALVRAALLWTGGQPYLTLKLCEELARQRLTSAQDAGRIVEETYPTLEAAKSDVHFETVLLFVKERVGDDDRLAALTLYRRIHRGRRERDLVTPAHISLKLSGLVKRDSHGLLVIGNPIYRRVFSSKWAIEAMPPIARAVRRARRWTVAATVLCLLTGGIWYEGIYPSQLATRLSAAVAEDRYALETYQLLRSIPFYSSKADRLWADLFDRRASNAERQEKRDDALLWRLKALSVHPTDRRAREAALLIGADYAQLIRAIHFSERESIALSGDGCLAGVAGEGIVRLWNTRDGDVFAEIPSRHNKVDGIQLSGDGSVLAAVDDKTVRLWRTKTRAPFAKSLTYESAVEALSLNRDGSVAGAFSYTSVMRLRRTETGEPIGRPLDNGSVTNALSGDGRVLAMGQGEEDDYVQLWQTETGKPIGEPLVCQGRLYTDNSVALNADGSVLAAANGTTVQLWRTEDGEPIGEPTRCGDRVFCVAISADGNLMATGCDGGTVQMWLLKTGLPVGKPLNVGTTVHRVAVANDGHVVAAGDRVVRAWKTTANDPVNTAYSDIDAAKAITLSGDGRALAMWNRKGRLQLWETGTGKPIGEPRDLGAEVRSIKLSDNGQLIAALTDRTVRLWRIEGWEPIGKPWRIPDFVYFGSMALSDDGIVLSGGEYDSVDLWRGESGERVGQPLEFEVENTYASAFSPDGSIAAAGGENGKVQLWRTESREPLGEQLQFANSVLSIAFSRDSRALLIATERWIHIFHLHANGLEHAASRLNPRYPRYGFAWMFLDEAGDRVQMVDGFRDNKVSGVTMQFGHADAEPVQGNPHELLLAWEKRLGLSIDRNGQIVPSTPNATGQRR